LRLGVRHGRHYACLCSRGCRAQEKSPPVHWTHCSFPSPDLPLPRYLLRAIADIAPVYTGNQLAVRAMFVPVEPPKNYELRTKNCKLILT